MSAIGGDKLEVFPRSADRSADRSGQLIGQLIIAMMTVTTATVGGNTITMGGRFSHPGNDANWIGVKLGTKENRVTGIIQPFLIGVRTKASHVIGNRTIVHVVIVVVDNMTMVDKTEIRLTLTRNAEITRNACL